MLVFKSDEFIDWLKKLRDRQAQLRIAVALDRMAQGKTGDVRPVGSGVSEMRLHFGPGYRLYFFSRNNCTYYLLAGGDKSSQADDIRRAIELKKQALEKLT
jgi:putative addiction module killer protein